MGRHSGHTMQRLARLPSSFSARSRSAFSKSVRLTIGGVTLVGLSMSTEPVKCEGFFDDKKNVILAASAVVVAGGLGYWLTREDDPDMNVAFVFIKPHAVTEDTKALVKSELQKQGINILSEGQILGTTIDEKKFIDQHYYSIASKATLLQPKELNVPPAKFQAQFGLSWESALQQGLVFNAMQACEKLNITPDQLDAKWGQAKKNKKLVKFGGGFYCGDIDGLYVFNGFFMSMRAKFTGDAKIYYYMVNWNRGDLKWEDFRGKVLGPTDPAEAPASSIRGQVAAQWKQLGLSAPCNVGDNAVHASASPFEALAELTNWLESGISSQPFGRRMLKEGISAETIKEWSVDPQVKLPGGKKGSLFDAVEDMDSTECLAKLVEIDSC